MGIQVSTPTTGDGSAAGKLNRLAKEKSPYLLSHADNPVNWYPWGEEAFSRAVTENKPIFLSIGYSTCHWCHVMEHESFEDNEIAGLMNRYFISIKVDREERPDIDKVYMNVCHMLTGSGGWPLTVIMTPEKEPFFAGTYFPRQSQFGRIGMKELLPQIHKEWIENRDKVQQSVDQIVNILSNANKTGSKDTLDNTDLIKTYTHFAQKFDQKNGGFNTAPKFPSPHNLIFLLRYWKATGESNALQMVESTLQSMRKGGVYDQVGYGFHRYSTDSKWFIPHFEKMLYDQALLATAYTEAWQATRNDLYKQTAEEILEYILRDMTDAKGGFYSAEDADSEGLEGKFYLWTDEELSQLLTTDENALVKMLFNTRKSGNYPEGDSGSNILHINEPFRVIAEKLSISEKTAQKMLKSARQKLFIARENRIHPLKDTKILTDWNGLMIAALAKAGRAFDESKYTEAAAKAADFIIQTLKSDKGRLMHRYRDGEVANPAIIDDYAFFTWGLIELYQTTYNTKYLKHAFLLTNEAIDHFWDSENGGFYFTADDGELLFARQKEVYDGAIPSGNSVEMLNLLVLARMTGNSDYEQKAFKIGEAFSGILRQSPTIAPQLMIALQFGINQSYEVVIVGDPESADTRKMIKAIHEKYLPNVVTILKPANGKTSEIETLAEFTRNHESIGGKSTAYVCRNFSCKQPTTDIEQMLKFLNE